MKNYLWGMVTIGALAVEKIQSSTVYESLLRGEVVPSFQTGDTIVALPYFDYNTNQSSSAFEELGKIVEVINLKKAKRVPIDVKATKDLPWNKVRDFKRRKTLKKG